MEVELFFLNKNCPSCKKDDVVAMYEQCYSNEKGSWYPGCCGKLCLRCGWMEENNGRMGFGWYTGKYCKPYDVELDSGEWDEDAVRLIKQMKRCDGDMDVTAAMRSMAQRRQQERNRRAQEDANRRARDAADARRRAQEEADRQARLRQQRLWEAQEAENQRREQERQEQLRREQERLRLERERQRQEQERLRREREEAERKAREAQNQRLYDQALERGKNALRAGRLQEAYNAFQEARRYQNTWELNRLLAQTLASDTNPDQHAQAIIKELEPYFKWKQETNREISGDQYLWLARAYAAVGRKDEASSNYYLAGDKAYDAKDYPCADRIYTEGLDKIYQYEKADQLFRIAYARSHAKAPTPAEDHRYCVKYYRFYLEKNGNDDAARTNLAYHYSELGEYQNAVDVCLPAAQRGKEPLAFGNLAFAYYKLEQWADAERWYERAAQGGQKRSHFRIGYSRMEQGKDAQAQQDFLRCVQEGTDVRPSYWNLGVLAKRNGQGRKAAEYYLKALQLGDEEYRKKWGPQALAAAEQNNCQDLAASMLNLLPWIKKEREEAARKAREEAERIAREKAEAERKAREEAERKRREEAERVAREKAEAERRAREEAARIAYEKAEAERRAREEAARKAREEEELLLLLL